MYDPKLGRFLSRDPVPANGVELLHAFPDMTRFARRSPFSRHPYSYCSNDPTNLTDPTGLDETAPTDVECCECYAAIYKAGNPKSINSQTDKPIRRCVVKMRCAKNCGHGTAVGWTDPPKPVPGSPVEYTIDMCIQCNVRSGSVDNVVRHELVHAQRFCNTPGLGPIKDCATCLAQEGPAYEESCKIFGKKGQPKYDDCVQCGKWLSCNGYKSPTGGECIQKPAGCDFGVIGIELKPYPE